MVSRLLATGAQARTRGRKKGILKSHGQRIRGKMWKYLGGIQEVCSRECLILYVLTSVLIHGAGRKQSEKRA